MQCEGEIQPFISILEQQINSISDFDNSRSDFQSKSELSKSFSELQQSLLVEEHNSIEFQCLSKYAQKQDLYETSQQSQIVSFSSDQYSLTGHYYFFDHPYSPADDSTKEFYDLNKNQHDKSQRINREKWDLDGLMDKSDQQGGKYENLIDDIRHSLVESLHQQTHKFWSSINCQPALISQNTLMMPIDSAAKDIWQNNFPQKQQESQYENLKKFQSCEQRSNKSLNKDVSQYQIIANLSNGSKQMKKGSEQVQISEQSQWMEQMDQFVIRQTVINDTVIVGFNSHLSNLLNDSHSKDYSFYSHQISIVDDEPVNSNLFKTIEKEMLFTRPHQYRSEILASLYEDEEVLQFLDKFVHQIKQDAQGEDQEKTDNMKVDEFDQNKIQDVSQLVIEILCHGYGDDIQRKFVDKVAQYFIQAYSYQQITKRIHQSFKLNVAKLPKNSYQDVKDLMKLGQYYLSVNDIMLSAKCYFTSITVATHQHWMYKDHKKLILIDKSFRNLNVIKKIIKQDRDKKLIYLNYFQQAENFQNKCRKILNDQLQRIQAGIQHRSRLQIQKYLSRTNQQSQDQQQMEEVQEDYEFYRKKSYYLWDQDQLQAQFNPKSYQFSTIPQVQEDYSEDHSSDSINPAPDQQ